MRSLGVYFLVAFFLVYQPFFLQVLKCQKNAAKDLAAAKIRNESVKLAKLTFHLNQSKSLKWEGKNEFFYKSKMYDVVRAEQSRDSITYSCYVDEHESNIVKEIEQLLAYFGIGVYADSREEEIDSLKEVTLFYEQFNFFENGWWFVPNKKEVRFYLCLGCQNLPKPQLRPPEATFLS